MRPLRWMAPQVHKASSNSKQANFLVSSLNKLHNQDNNNNNRLQLALNNQFLPKQKQSSLKQIVANAQISNQIKVSAKILLIKINSKTSLLQLIVMMFKISWSPSLFRIRHRVTIQAEWSQANKTNRIHNLLGKTNRIQRPSSQCQVRMETTIKPSHKVICTACLQILTPWHRLWQWLHNKSHRTISVRFQTSPSTPTKSTSSSPCLQEFSKTVLRTTKWANKHRLIHSLKLKGLRAQSWRTSKSREQRQIRAILSQVNQ